MMDDRLLEVLACPACHGGVRAEAEEIVCKECGRRYPIRDGIPVMLIDESTRAEEAGGDLRVETN